MQYNFNVEHLQQRLLDLGYDVGAFGADGIFGDDTKQAAFTALDDLESLKNEGDIPDDKQDLKLEYIPYCKDLKKGDKGEDVAKLQRLLLRWHMDYYLGQASSDGIFGSGTQKAVKEFQMGMGKKSTGKANKNLWELLNLEPIDISRWTTPQADDGRLPFECNCNGRYCKSRENAKAGATSVGLMILIERIQKELNRRYNRDDILLRLTDDMDTAKHDDRNGGNRCTVWNSMHGGAKHSQHINCCAADLFAYVPYAKGKAAPDNHALWEVCDELNPYGGVGKYQGNVHVDTRGSRGRW